MRDVSLLVHGIEAENAAKIGKEENFVSNDLRSKQ